MLLIDKLEAAEELFGHDHHRLYTDPEFGIFDVTNVAEMYYRGGPLDDDDWKTDSLLQEFPCLIAPYPKSYLEFKFTEVIRQVIDAKIHDADNPDRPFSHIINGFGMTYTCLSIPPELRLNAVVNDPVGDGIEEILKRKNIRLAGGMIKLNLKKVPWWGVAVSLFAYATGKFSPDKAPYVAPIGVVGFYLDKNGAYIPDSARVVPYSIESINEDGEAVVSDMLRLAAPLYYALGIMHARNAEFEVVEPPKKLQKARARRKKEPLHVHRILKVTPFGKRKVGGGGDKDSKGIQPWHIRRGHLRYYHPDRPMFGNPKLHGWWWVDAYEAGDLSRGTVTKSYDVHPRRS